MFSPTKPVYTCHAEVKGRLAAVMKLLAIPLGCPKAATKWLVMLLGVVLFAATALAWAAEESGIAVIYPDIGEPYRGIFAKIIEGIEYKVGTPVGNHPVRADTDIGGLKASLLRQNTKVVIALGRQGMKTATVLSNGIRVVVGGVLTVPENGASGQPVISLSPDPALLFARLKALMPAAKRVFVVYDPGFNGWLMKLANEAAHAQGLELVAYETQDLRGAVRFYQKIFSAADGQHDVLWLPQDSTTVEESSILPLVLQESWKQGIAVFSSNSAHVRRGVLFSLYPDNVALGKSLAGLAQGILASGDYGRRGVMPLRDVQSAVNLRTAKHLRLNPGHLQGFDTTFPEQ
ncbi:MAG: ABC transporter substrate binding protein [Gallionella sp.]|nr:ABC transporter substrate binding protein [Gallionella sp.]